MYGTCKFLKALYWKFDQYTDQMIVQKIMLLDRIIRHNLSMTKLSHCNTLTSFLAQYGHFVFSSNCPKLQCLPVHLALHSWNVIRFYKTLNFLRSKYSHQYTNSFIHLHMVHRKLIAINAIHASFKPCFIECLYHRRQRSISISQM